MIYSESEQKNIVDFWNNICISHCPNCQGKGKVGEELCKCVVSANVSAALELNGFGRKFLLGKLTNETLKQKISNYLENFDQYLREGKGLFVFSLNNREKELAMTILAKTVLAIENPLGLNDFNIKFFLYDDLVRLSYDDRSFTILEPIIKKTNILVIACLGEEVGRKTAGQSSLVLLKNIIRNRDMRGLPIWFTTKFSDLAIKDEYDQEISDLLKQTTITMSV